MPISSAPSLLLLIDDRFMSSSFDQSQQHQYFNDAFGPNPSPFEAYGYDSTVGEGISSQSSSQSQPAGLLYTLFSQPQPHASGSHQLAPSSGYEAKLFDENVGGPQPQEAGMSMVGEEFGHDTELEDDDDGDDGDFCERGISIGALRLDEETGSVKGGRLGFATRLFDLIQDPDITCVNWTEDGKHFVVSDEKDFMKVAGFKTTKYESIVRQFSGYGFKKSERSIQTNQGVHGHMYHHKEDKFMRDRPELISKIRRSSTTKSTKTAPACEDTKSTPATAPAQPGPSTSTPTPIPLAPAPPRPDTVLVLQTISGLWMQMQAEMAEWKRQTLGEMSNCLQQMREEMDESKRQTRQEIESLRNEVRVLRTQNSSQLGHGVQQPYSAADGRDHDYPRELMNIPGAYLDFSGGSLANLGSAEQPNVSNQAYSPGLSQGDYLQSPAQTIPNPSPTSAYPPPSSSSPFPPMNNTVWTTPASTMMRTQSAHAAVGISRVGHAPKRRRVDGSPSEPVNPLWPELSKPTIQTSTSTFQAQQPPISPINDHRMYSVGVVPQLQPQPAGPLAGGRWTPSQAGVARIFGL
ncbi:hypothetical protein FRB97_002799 [Tulasnella sp. 331]|nr:hypothetical protein FRB97_002799 [Tulasnella sp. 331]